MDSSLSVQGVCDIAGWGLIRARGADAGKFLQGQLTNDVLSLDARSARLAGFCSAKGRLQASFVVWRDGEDGYLLACAADLLASTVKRLSMFVLRAQCKLSDAGGELAWRGAVGDAALAWTGTSAPWSRSERDGVTVIRLPDAAGVPRALLVCAAPMAGSSLPSADLSSDVWTWLDVQSGIVTIEAGTVDRFVPQMVNFELVGGVDFQKGCYPGQEVVARSQYRGTTKRRTLLFDSDVPAVVGQDVYSTATPGEPAGVVASAAARPGSRGSSVLVEIRLAALDGELHLGALDGPLLRRVDLPYAVALDAESAA